MTKSPKIVLPKDANTKERLEKKLEEYRGRISEDATNLYIVKDATYKTAIIEKLLETGEVDTWELSLELNKKYGCIDITAFNSACGVIDDYCKTDGKHTRNGTGF